MRIASVLTPLSDDNLRLAAQCGVEDIILRYPGGELADLLAARDRIASYGMRIGAIEGYLPIEHIKVCGSHGETSARDRELAAMKQLLRHMAVAEIPVCCYNFMPGTDWVRTAADVRERGDAWVTAFRLTDAQRAARLDYQGTARPREPITAETLWLNLEWFLRELLPVAEASGVVLCMHPDDPPLPEFLGQARIMNRVESFERLVELVPSPHNAICFCQGSFAEMGVDIPATIRRLGKYIRYVHFRDVRGTADDFVETFHDNGPTDMVAAMRAYHEIGFQGSLRPDHVPQLVGEEGGPAGYTMLGRLFAFGYMRGLIQAVAQSPTSRVSDLPTR